MKKLTFLVTNKEYEPFLADIRKMGVVHIEELQSGATSPEFEEGQTWAHRYDSAIKALDFAVETYKTDQTFTPINLSSMTQEDVITEGQRCVGQIETLQDEEIKVRHQIELIEKNLNLLEPWGEFDSSKLEELANAGYQVHFFACPAKLMKKEWGDEFFATPIAEINKKIYFITFSAQKPDITAESIELPKRPISSFKNELEQLKGQLDDIHSNLLNINGVNRNVINAAKVENENSISLSKVHLSTSSIANEAVKLIVGWIPAEKFDDIKQFLDENKFFYEAETPSFEDNVPIEIKNDSYSSLFEPILRMYSLPNYHDLDVTPFFAPFFMLFFGLCMGDAGYGLIILLISLILKNKMPEEQKPYAKLGIFLGAMTMICGGLTGSFLGIDLTQQDWAFLAPVKHKFISENNFQLFGYSPMMVISVFIGFIQVLLGMVLAAVKAGKLFGWQFGIGKMSWVTALIASVILFGLPLCGVSLSSLVTYILYGIIGVSVLGIFFYNTPNKNIFMNFATGIWDTYSMATGLLGDLLSYIRLFALGLTGGVLGGVFNALAFDLTSSLPWGIRWLPMLFILLFGHGINFALCMISSFVHPMRLTFVEFFKNANFEGGGKEYSPFRIKTYAK